MPLTPIIKYIMSGRLNFVPYQKVTWGVFNTPDMTGQFSGYVGQIDTSTIAIDYTIESNLATEVAIPTYFTPTGPAGGDLGGSYPNPTVINIQGHPVSPTAPTNQQTLIWDSTSGQWIPHTPLSGPPSGTAGGDLSGTYPNPSVIAINGLVVQNSGVANYVLAASTSLAGSWRLITDANIASGAAIEYVKLALSNSIVNNDINSGAGIVYSKLSLGNSIVNSDINTSAAIAYSKLNLTGDIVNSDINSSAGIVYSKLNLTGGIVNSDVNASAAIAGSKIVPNFGSQNLTAGASNLGTIQATSIAVGGTTLNNLQGGIEFSKRTVTSTASINNSQDFLIHADTSGGAFTLTLPDPATTGNGQFFVIKDAAQSFATHNLTLAPHGAEKIDGVAGNLILQTNNEELFVYCDGTNWQTNFFSTAPSGPAGGDLGGTYPNPTVVNINGSSVPAGGSLTTGNVLQVNGGANLIYAPINLAGGSNYVTGTLPWGNIGSLTLTGDVSGTNSGGAIATTVNFISGSSPVSITNAPTFQWSSAISSPILTQGDATSGDGQTLTVRAQKSGPGTQTGGQLTLSGGDGHNGGNALVEGHSGSATGGNATLQGGNCTFATGAQVVAGAGNGSVNGSVTLSVTHGAGFNELIVSDANGVTINYMGTGVVHSDSAGNLTSSLIVNGDISSSAAIAYSKLNLTGDIVNADISSSAAIAVNKLAVGTAGQILMNNATPTPTWTSISGDITLGNTGSVTVTKIQGNAVKVETEGSAQDGYALTWVNADNQWEAKPVPSGVTWANDLAASTNTHQYIAAISGSGGAGGTVPMHITTLEYDNSQSTPVLHQASPTTALAGDGGPGQALSIISQAGQSTSGASHNGGNGGSLILASGVGGTGPGANGLPGTIKLQIGNGTDNIIFNTGIQQFQDVGNITINQIQKVSTGANTGSSWTIQAQQGQQQSGSNANNNGGGLTLSSGSAGTGGSGAAGAAGNILLQTGGTTRLTISPTNITVAAFSSAGVVKNDSSGNLSSGTISNTDISASAGIAVSKIAAGSAGQLLLSNATPATTWTTMGGDATISSSGSVTVSKINGTTVSTAGGSLTTGTVLRVTGSSTSDWGAVDLANSSAVTGVLAASHLGTVTLTGDVTGSGSGGSISTTVAAISGSSPIAITPTNLQWTAGTSTPEINHLANASTSIGNGTVGQIMTIKAQDGQAATGVSHNGGDGGPLALSSGSGGTSGSATPGNPGKVKIQIGGTDNVLFGSASQQFQDVGDYNINVAQKGSTGANNGTAINIKSQQGQQQSGSNANNNGGNLTLSSGSAGTGGSGAAGTSGSILLQTGGTTRLTLSDTNVTVAAFGTAGVVHNDSSGNLTSSTIVDADVSSSAAIAVSKLAAGTNNFVLTTVSGVPTWAAGGGGSVTWANDLVNSTGTNQYVSSLSYSSSSAGGTIAINGTSTVLQWANNTVPVFNQAALASTSSGSGSTGQDFSVTAQAGQAATGASHNGGNGGNLVFQAGLGGTSGSATAGLDGYLKFKSGVIFPSATKTSDYTITYSNYHILCNFSAGHTLTLPVPLTGLTFEVWDIAGTAETNNITLARNGSEKISGIAASKTLKTNWGHWKITSDGTDWYVG